MTERLDRIEAVLWEIAESQRRSESRINRIERFADTMSLLSESNARLTESNTRAIATHGDGLRASEARLDRIEQLTESNARAIAAHSEELRTSIADIVNMVGTVAANLQRQSDQAEIDRAEFRAQFQQLIEVLTQQYNGNGRRE